MNQQKYANKGVAKILMAQLMNDEFPTPHQDLFAHPCVMYILVILVAILFSTYLW